VGYLIAIVALFALLWLLVLRPQRTRRMQQLRMQDTLHVGDEVITAGGIRGYVRQLDEEVLKVEIAPNVEVRLDRRAVAAVVPQESEEPEEEPEEPEDAEELERAEEPAEPVAEGPNRPKRAIQNETDGS
jgi:preprotein translocase subunit YajC